MLLFYKQIIINHNTITILFTRTMYPFQIPESLKQELLQKYEQRETEKLVCYNCGSDKDDEYCKSILLSTS